MKTNETVVGIAHGKLSAQTKDICHSLAEKGISLPGGTERKYAHRVWRNSGRDRITALVGKAGAGFVLQWLETALLV